MTKKIFIIYCLITVSVSSLFAQQKQELFTVDAFIQFVKQYHPLAKQANIQVDKAAAELLSAKGAFDPAVTLETSNKTFDGKNYYYYTNPELKIPTPIGVDIKTGLENNGGVFINEESTAGKTSYLGVEVALAKGLLMDKRRAVLRQAKIFRNQSEQERLKMLNDLLFEAYVAYWQWAGNYQLYSIYNKFLQISTDRLRLVRIAFQNGDRALMDTVEAYTQVQNFQLLQTDALLKFNNASLELSNYLWLQNDSPVLLPKNYVPDTVQFALQTENQVLDQLITRSSTENPNLKAYDFKLGALEVERKLKMQSLLPVFNVKANLLNKDYNVVKGVDAAFLQNNYKFGVDFKMPLFLREGRGDYKKTQLKIKETNFEFSNKKWETENKIRYYFNENTLLSQQINTVQNMYKNYSILLKNEELRFSQGESSLFLVNSRENKVIESLQKMVELRIKYFKAKYATEWAAGLLR
ncbi:MAG: TolC family protein [Chitinophagaceae bacterium]